MRCRLGAVLMLVLITLAATAPPPARAREPGAVSVAERVDVGDARLYLEVRGRSADAPLLLWLHGGPGGAERPLFRYFNRGLEADFLIAYLDQRGAGRSYDPEAPASRLTVAQHLSDLDRVVDHLRARYGRERVLLVGHSWGAMLGMLYAEAHPEKLEALVCAAPVVSFAEHAQREFAFDMAEAERRGDEDALRRLREIGPPPYADADALLRLQRVTERFGGMAFRRHNRLALVAEGIVRGLVTPGELGRIFEANEVSLRAMHAELSRLDMRAEVNRLDVPVFFFLGRHDRHVDAELAGAYFETLSAPMKLAVWFERSAHDIPFDEPDLFNARVREAWARAAGR